MRFYSLVNLVNEGIGLTKEKQKKKKRGKRNRARASPIFNMYAARSSHNPARFPTSVMIVVKIASEFAFPPQYRILNPWSALVCLSRISQNRSCSYSLEQWVIYNFANREIGDEHRESPPEIVLMTSPYRVPITSLIFKLSKHIVKPPGNCRRLRPQFSTKKI